MIPKQSMGNKKQNLIPKLSASQPIAGVMNAPPATAITSKEDARLVWAPKFLMPREKMVGNIIDIKNWQATKQNIAPIEGINTTGNSKQRFTAA